MQAISSVPSSWTGRALATPSISNRRAVKTVAITAICHNADDTKAHKWYVGRSLNTRLNATKHMRRRKITVILAWVTCVRGYLNNHALFIIVISYPSAAAEGVGTGGGVSDQLSQVSSRRRPHAWRCVLQNKTKTIILKRPRQDAPLLWKSEAEV